MIQYSLIEQKYCLLLEQNDNLQLVNVCVSHLFLSMINLNC